MASEQKSCWQDSFGAKDPTRSLRQRATQLGIAMPSDQSSLVQVAVTCDGGLEDIDGSLPLEGHRQDDDQADQTRDIPG